MLSSPRGKSVVGSFAKLTKKSLTRRSLEQLETKETRWHVSSHYYMEQFAAEILEDLIQDCPDRQSRYLMTTQLHDKTEHAMRYRILAEKLGFEPGARRLAGRCRTLYRKAGGWPERVFFYYTLCRGLSIARLDWRLQNMADPLLQQTDDWVRDDEWRHLRQGHKIFRRACHLPGYPVLSRPVLLGMYRSMLELIRRDRNDMLKLFFRNMNARELQFHCSYDQAIARRIIGMCRLAEAEAFPESRARTSSARAKKQLTG